MTKDLLAAHRYAQALFEIARDMHQDQLIESELESISAALKQTPRIEKFLANPSLTTDQKRKLLERIYQEHRNETYEILINFFTILFEKNRFYLIHDISVHFKKIVDEARGQGVAEIRSASNIKPDAEKRIVSRLEHIAGYKIQVKKIVDPTLIGGVVVKIRNNVIDNSVVNKIRLIKKELTKIQNI